jgi:hypothetical protein
VAELASPIVWRPLLDERVQPFLAIFGGRDKRKTLGGILDRAAEIGIDRAMKASRPIFMTLEDLAARRRLTSRARSRAVPFGTPPLNYYGQRANQTAAVLPLYGEAAHER